MRAFNVKLLGCIGLFIVLAMLINGCGSGNDLLDEVGGTTTFNLELSDGGDDNTQQLDIFQILDCDDNGTFDDPEDPLTPVFGTVTVTVSETAPGMSFLSYVVNFIPVPTVGEDNIAYTPPTLTSKSGQFNSFDVDSASSGSDSFIIMTVDQKQYVYTQLLLNANLDAYLYTIEIVITYKDYEGNTSTKSIYRDVEFANVNRC